MTLSATNSAGVCSEEFFDFDPHAKQMTLAAKRIKIFFIILLCVLGLQPLRLQRYNKKMRYANIKYILYKSRQKFA